MVTKIEVRSAVEADFNPLCALYCNSVKCNPQGFIQDLNFHGCMIAKTRAWRAGGGDTLVALGDGRVVGMGALAPSGSGKAELCKLHVDEALQGKGIGKLLCKHLITRAAALGFSEVELHVTVTQKAALRLYERLGFRPVKQEIFTTTVFGERTTFDTLFMHLPLHAAEAELLAG